MVKDAQIMYSFLNTECNLGVLILNIGFDFVCVYAVRSMHAFILVHLLPMVA